MADRRRRRRSSSAGACAGLSAGFENARRSLWRFSYSEALAGARSVTVAIGASKAFDNRALPCAALRSASKLPAVGPGKKIDIV
jgi:hypothetical protein